MYFITLAFEAQAEIHKEKGQNSSNSTRYAFSSMTWFEIGSRSTAGALTLLSVAEVTPIHWDLLPQIQVYHQCR